MEGLSPYLLTDGKSIYEIHDMDSVIKDNVNENPEALYSAYERTLMEYIEFTSSLTSSDVQLIEASVGQGRMTHRFRSGLDAIENSTVEGLDKERIHQIKLKLKSR